MFKQLLNEFRVNLSFIPQGPILIKSGNTLSAGTDMSFVKTFRNGRPEVYLPGSSLKGVIRSHAEKIGRTLHEKAICNPFNSYYTQPPQKNPSAHGVPSCSDAFQKLEKARKKLKKARKNLLSYEIYQGSCPACRLFGSLAMGGRFNISDAYLDADENPPQPEYRDGVGIDRFTGGAVNKAKFDYEVITQGEFFATLRITNFELWQLSLISYVLQDLKDRMVGIGMGTSRGLGTIKAEIHQIEVDVISVQEPQGLDGIGALYHGEHKTDYGFAHEEAATLPEGLSFSRQGVRQRVTVGSNEQQQAFFESIQDYFPKFIDQFKSLETWRKQHELSI